MAGAVLDVDRARVARSGDGAVVFDDPCSPWVVRVWPGRTGGIMRLRIDVRDDATPVTAARLARLPVAQLLQVAAADYAGDNTHPNEVYYRMLARPRRPGCRSWDDGHWERVAEVHDWAITSGRPGGGVKAVADLWGVAVNPTAYRWLAEARRRAEATGWPT